jgi:hypothetical protein
MRVVNRIHCQSVNEKCFLITLVARDRSSFEELELANLSDDLRALALATKHPHVILDLGPPARYGARFWGFSRVWQARCTTPTENWRSAATTRTCLESPAWAESSPRTRLLQKPCASTATIALDSFNAYFGRTATVSCSMRTSVRGV